VPDAPDSAPKNEKEHLSIRRDDHVDHVIHWLFSLRYRCNIRSLDRYPDSQAVLPVVARYGFEPLLVESFVDMERYSGGCFRAANRLSIGATAGRGRSAPTRPAKTRKALYLHELRRDWRSAWAFRRAAKRFSL